MVDVLGLVSWRIFNLFIDGLFLLGVFSDKKILAFNSLQKKKNFLVLLCVFFFYSVCYCERVELFL